MNAVVGQSILEHVQDEMMPPVVWAVSRVIIVPLAIVDGDLHFRRIAVIHTIATAIVFITVEILRVVDVWVVLEPWVIPATSGPTPCASIGIGFLSLRYGYACQSSHDGKSRNQDGSSQHNLPPGD